jgi:hypothetical protein
MNSNQRSFQAAEDIGSSLFVVVSGVHTVSVAGAGEAVYGVSHEGSREAPIPGVTPLAAATGESVLVYGPGDNCEVLCGAAVAAGAFVKSDAAGKAVTAGSENYYGQAINATSAADQKLKNHSRSRIHPCVTSRRVGWFKNLFFVSK